MYDKREKEMCGKASREAVEAWSEGGMSEGGEQKEGGKCMFCSTETISSLLILPFIFPLV